jgi:hypothetical protein
MKSHQIVALFIIVGVLVLVLVSCGTVKYGCPATRHSSGYVQGKPHSHEGRSYVVATGFNVR